MCTHKLLTNAYALNMQILETEDVLSEIVENDDKYVSPDEVKSILKLYDLDTEKYETLLSEAGIEDASEVRIYRPVLALLDSSVEVNNSLVDHLNECPPIK